MKKKLLRILPAVIILGMIVAIPASTQIWTGTTGGDETGSNLPLLLLVNRLELTTEQMEDVRDVLLGIQESREVQQARIGTFEEEMIAFDGSAEELDERLEAFRLESEEEAELTRESIADAIERLTEILTFKQGEMLQNRLPGLLGGGGDIPMRGITDTAQRGAVPGRITRAPMEGSDERSMASNLRQQMQARIEQQFENRPESLEGLRERFGGLFDDEDTETESGLGFRGRVEIQVDGQRFGREFGSPVARGSMGRSAGEMIGRRLQSNRIDQLIEVLTLKLEAQQ